MSLGEWKDFFTIIGVFVTAGGIIWAVYVYRRNSKLERVKWIASLYEKFYEKDDLKLIRELIDCETTAERKSNQERELFLIVEKQTKEFTDYLNFFELIAFLKKNKQLSLEQIKDLFGYYLECLERHKIVRDYLAPNGYELLDGMLKEIAGKNK